MMKVFNAVKPDLVIHTATPSVLDGNKKLLHKVNVEGTRTLLEVAGGEHGDWGGKCKAFVYTSSSSVVHDTQSDLKNVNEEWPLIRGRLQKEYYSETKVSTIALRRPLCQHPRQSANQSLTLVPPTRPTPKRSS
jgi:sterol-4alpha-carboxylate 3-dehydrogenase (decarboxylating)